MNKKQIITFGAIALLSASATPRILGADVEIKADTDTPRTETRINRDRLDRVDRDVDVSVRTDREHAKLRHSNKASGLLGMEVRNRDNQKLGEIKDLVMTSPGRVSYAVLAVGGVLGIGEKLIALPPSTLHVAEDGEYLILNADKAQIQAAPGFAATAWPSPNDPEIDRFWNNIKATGAPAGAERNHRSSDVDVDVSKDRHSLKSDVNVEKDRTTKIYTDADKDKKIKIDVNKD